VGNAAAEAVIGWLSFFADTYRTIYGMAGPPVHDACAVALVIDPSLVRTVETFVAIETEGRWTRGATAVDLYGRLGQPPNAKVAMELDVNGFWDVVVDAIAKL
jgi:purine nucleosidase/pyrimidine-specific ribonucleoside hydrolase